MSFFRIVFFLFVGLLLSNACNPFAKNKDELQNIGFQSLFEAEHKTYFKDKEGVFGNRHMLSCAHEIAARLGDSILISGGNAIDAAIAVHFALAVVYPFAGNIGGGGFAVIRDTNNITYSLDFREKAPLLSRKDMYLDESGEVIDNLSLFGHLAVGVPGSVAGLKALHKRWGSKTWSYLLQPSINLAKNGFILSESDANGLNMNMEQFNSMNGMNHPFKHPKNKAWKAGDTLIQNELAATLKRMATFGADEFYRGKTAQFLVESMNKNGGIISQQDLLNYLPVWREPISCNYRGYTIYSMPPPSSGGIVLCQLLQIVEDYPLRKMGWNNDSVIQLFVAAQKRVYADRSEWLGDNDFFDVPMNELLSKQYTKERMRDFKFGKFEKSADIKAGMPTKEAMETTHFSIIDENGMAISLTTTLNGAYGSKVFVENAGFLLNNEMDDFSIKAGAPNMFGLIGSEANAIAPGKRMLSSMTPCIITKDNALNMVLGTPGGSTIITSVFQTLVNVIDFEMGMQAAVNALKFHHQWLPEEVFYEEGRFSEEQLARYNQMGQLFTLSNLGLGRMDCIMVHPDGSLEGGSDPRGNNISIGR